MKIAVLSGKGGTGKTTVSACLAATLNSCQYLDCDVEEPNGALFLKPQLEKVIPVKVLVPEVDPSRCTGCGKCAQVCQFHALAAVKGTVLQFSELCHHCGACQLVCPEAAIHETEREIGVIEASGDQRFLQGRLNIGEPVSVPIIRELKRQIRTDLPVILDCPPGAACAVVQAIDGCDFCILVTEPTPFGLHDVKIAIELVRKLGIPFGVVINKAMAGQRMIHEYCESNQVAVLLEIPYSRELAANYSRGILPVQDDLQWQEQFRNLFSQVEEIIKADSERKIGTDM
jgi:MinD superfamily P-loop ATPase